MYQVKTLNKISPVGLAHLTESYILTDKTEDADAILVRSQDMHEMAFSDKLKAIAGIAVTAVVIVLIAIFAIPALTISPQELIAQGDFERAYSKAKNVSAYLYIVSSSRSPTER